ncbi:MAG: aminotransferase class III-fold pyridoxal phosphate-dependent enzyme [Gemmatimonadota bacterium]|nr:aminotransferase class III-fold pyridoxal phosphate-dependent enzyme [Gemmatimonadota bacterium]
MSVARSVERSVEQSMRMYRRAEELIPGWTQLISRRASQFANGVSPVYAESAKGARFVDVDGNEYLDMMNAVSAIILGHADDVVDGAVKEQIDRGSIYTLNGPLEIELAEELIDTIPSAEMVRYAKAGGETCALAARIVRGTTGRDIILFCGYHGWHDWYQSANYLVDPESGEYPFAGIEPIGVPRVLAGTAIPFTYGDLDMLSDLLKRYDGQVAAVMMEPARSELPPPGYLEGVKSLAHEHGALLVFDEVSCGWRFRIGGFQEYTGVTPDVTTLAKAMSNGYAMGAVVGSREAMAPAASMFVSSSYWSDNVGLAAALTTIRELKRRDSVPFFDAMGELVKKTMNEALASAGLPGACVGLSYNPGLAFDLPDPELTPVVSTLFVQEMSRRGVFTPTSFRVTMAHTEEDIRQLGEAAAEVFGLIKSGLDRGNLSELLVCDLKKEPFRRLVR